MGIPTPPIRPLRTATPLAVIALAVVLAATGVPGAGPAVADSPGTAAGGTGIRTVTLITGDKVSVGKDGSVTGIERAEGREGASFSVRKLDGHTYVTPGDAALPVVQGKLDQRLFDITQLLAYGYDDARRSDLPLIVTYGGDTTPAASAFRAARAKVSQRLDTVNGVALRADKRGGAAFWNTFTDGADGGEGTARLTGSPAVKKVEKVWLDGKRQADLDRSVPQIGAPAAWDAGFDGTGVKVAVLDTGVDETHPDLADQEIAERNFSDSPDSVDRNGHGTHVASTIAGTGAKSEGKYKGVAPGARILAGKVLDDAGRGWDSDIIAGMEWAVAEGADVVNMSMGGTDTMGIDPLEETVNRLSATSDTLFVIAAGNEGYAGESTVGSPGSAASALTVGAVDNDDKLADFSSRGPRVGDGGLKPDLTAPGVDIVAAASTASNMEEWYPDPAGTAGYAELSGTSMATPHVAGAAALLAQQHPEWTGERIKAALTGSAKPGPYSAYQQGTGRTDVARAITQTVVAENGPISFGRPAWPHTDDEPVAKEITYRNLGGEPVTLDLSFEALGVDGKPAPEGLFGISSRQVTVPAGGTASTTVTADTRVGGETYGSWGGSVTAASADGKVSVRTAFGVEREAESYNLTVKQLDGEGKPTGNGLTRIDGRDRAYTADLADADGELTVRLPKGSYALTGILGEGTESAAGTYFLAPDVELDKDTTIVMDAREAESVKVTLPDAEARNDHAQLIPGYTRTDGQPLQDWAVYAFPDFRSFKVAHIGPEVSKDTAYAQYSGFWRSAEADGRAVNYRMAWNRTGALGAFTADVRREDLAKIDLTFGAPAPDTGLLFAMPFSPDGRIAADFSTPVWRELPMRTTEYVLGNGVKWGYASEQWNALSSLLGQSRSYEAGKSYTRTLNVGVFGPSLPRSEGEPVDLRPGLARQGNTIKAVLPLFGDGAGNVGSSAYTLEASLRADGEEIPVDGDPLYRATYTVPSQNHRYELSLDATRDPEMYPVSTRVRAQWTFRSTETSADSWTRLPLSVVRFSPELSPTSTAKAGVRLDVPFTIEGAADKRTVKKLKFKVSYDDGKTWTPTPVVGGNHLSLHHPPEPGTVSLRAELTDRHGNTLVQTVDRAYLTVQ
ncbi:S8 family serine peptidase [Streptomyces sp. NPDC046909]|uniref:S8 family peptidase n=1 Tax=Streptomyces sp. NPDC046909 TaxID=3155617 RepID=UPI0033C1B3A5